MATRQSKNRKDRAFYFIATLLALGFVVPATIPSLLPAYIAFASALGTLTGLYFGANVSQKVLTKDSYVRELELEQEVDSEENNLGGTF